MTRSSTAPPDCDLHEVPRLNYLAYHDDATRRHSAGEKQRRCPRCERWVWEDLYYKRTSEAQA